MKKNLISLQKSILFKNKSIYEIQELLLKCDYRIKDFKKNKYIYMSGLKSENIGIILNGEVNIKKIFPSGKLIITQKKRVLDLIGENTVFSQMIYYSDNAITSKNSRILLLDMEKLKIEIMKDNELMMSFMEILSRSNLELNHKIGIISLNSIQEKISIYLYHFIEHNKDFIKENSILLPYSKKDWADYLNVSRTSLSRELKKMVQKKILEVDKRKITILNKEMLKSLIDL